MDTQNDTDAIALSKAIAKAESGGTKDPYNQRGASGEFGAYQFMPDTWKLYSKEILGDENAQPTMENQNKVTYGKVKKWKDAGFNPAQIASMWNAGEDKPNAYKENWRGVNKYGVAYDTPAYAQKVSQYYKAQPKEAEASTIQPKAEQPAEKGGALFKSSPEDTALQAGLKTVGNIPGSLWEFGKGVLSALNPLNTLQTISEIGPAYRALKEEGGNLGDVVKELPSEAYKGLVPQGIRQVISGDIAGAQKTFTEKPIETVAPAVLAAVGGVKALSKGEIARNQAAMKQYAESPYTTKTIPKTSTTWQGIDKAMEKGISQTAGIVTKPVGAVTGLLSKGAGMFARSIASQLTSLDPQTISTVLSDPKQFSKMAQENVSRGGLAGEVNSAITSRLSDLSELGKGYDAIRSSPQVITVEPNFIPKVLAENGLKVSKGKIIADTKSITRNTADINALQKFYNNWGKKTKMTPDEFLNMRADLTDLAKFDRLTGMGKTQASQTISKNLRNKLNTEVRDVQLQELKALDDSYAPEVQFLRQAKRDYFDRNGAFKDGAVNKIANASNKAQLLSRLEQIVPGIGKRLEILKAVEDIERASGIKVGSYTRGVLQGGAVLSGNLAMIVATIITHPTVAVKIIRSAGLSKNAVSSVVNALKVVGGDIKIPNAGKVTGIYQKNDLQLTE